MSPTRSISTAKARPEPQSADSIMSETRWWSRCNRLGWRISSRSTRNSSSMRETIQPRTAGMLLSVSGICPALGVGRVLITAPLVHGLGECIGCLGAIPCVICCPNPFRPVGQGEVGLISKFGRYVLVSLASRSALYRMKN